MGKESGGNEWGDRRWEGPSQCRYDAEVSADLLARSLELEAARLEEARRGGDGLAGYASLLGPVRLTFPLL